MSPALHASRLRLSRAGVAWSGAAEKRQLFRQRLVQATGQCGGSTRRTPNTTPRLRTPSPHGHRRLRRLIASTRLRAEGELLGVNSSRRSRDEEGAGRQPPKKPASRRSRDEEGAGRQPPKKPASRRSRDEEGAGRQPPKKPEGSFRKTPGNTGAAKPAGVTGAARLPASSQPRWRGLVGSGGKAPAFSPATRPSHGPVRRDTSSMHPCANTARATSLHGHREPTRFLRSTRLRAEGSLLGVNSSRRSRDEEGAGRQPPKKPGSRRSRDEEGSFRKTP